MKTISLQPGSAEWQKARSASKAAAVMGTSPYQTRSELLRQMATGIVPDVDRATQARFDNGHRTEEAARAIAEDLLGDGLSPISGATDDGYLTANFDGLTFDGRIGWEHKDWNETLAAAVRAKDIPASHWPQLEQQIIVGELDYVLFMVSDGTREKCVSMEYRAVPGRAQQLIAAWKQFDADLASYVPPEVIPAAVAAPIKELPAIQLSVGGALTIESNFDIWGKELDSFIACIPTKPSTDQEFADCKAAVTALKKAEEQLDAEEARVLSQVASIDEMKRQKKYLFDLSRSTRLALEKLVVARDIAVKQEIVQAGKDAAKEHIAALNARLGMACMPVIAADFAAAIKNKRSYESMRNAVADAVAHFKTEANTMAERIQINLSDYAIHKPDYGFLFPDIAALVVKAPDDFAAAVMLRINTHKAAEVTRLERERERIAAEERAKIEREQREADTKRQRAEELERHANATAAAAREVAERHAPAVPAQADVSVATAKEVFKPSRARLNDRLDCLVGQMTDAELSDLVIHASHMLSNRAQKVAA